MDTQPRDVLTTPPSGHPEVIRPGELFLLSPTGDQHGEPNRHGILGVNSPEDPPAGSLRRSDQGVRALIYPSPGMPWTGISPLSFPLEPQCQKKGKSEFASDLAEGKCEGGGNSLF